jgi:hypothetical protein
MENQDQLKSEALSPAPKSENLSSDPALKPSLSYGEKAVGITFNPSSLDNVAMIKRLSADLIDELNNQRELAKAQNNGEKIAQFTLAIRSIQEGQMWGVKASTWQY